MESEKKVTVYSPESPLRNPGRLLAGLWRDLLRSRQLIWMLFTRDLKASHRQSVLGYVWLALPSFATAAVWVVMRSQRIIQIETEVPYILFVLIGTTTWISFVAFLNAPLLGFKAGKSVIVKLNVPAEAFIFSALLKVCFETIIRFLALIPVYFMLGYWPTAQALLLPVALISCFSAAVGIGLFLTPLGELYSDIGKAINTSTRILMYSVPVIFPLGRRGWLNDILEANPLTPGIMFVRDSITTGSMEWAGQSLLIAGITGSLGILSIIVIRIARPHLIERMGM